jgi:hypothetical protein
VLSPECCASSAIVPFLRDLHHWSRLMTIRLAEPSPGIRQAPAAKTAKVRCRFF